ncbi:class I SAM-dependent methyltransferase [Nocardioides ferulae]|uniref:class I SAM-dependent methyltransferase n=1 Tax=Nocardioides ferulae TaxID=2340821 RepID=UPI000EB3E34B|nr:class I SAM-dependent methyltransferase [Nocardioides ferulae]
MAVRGWWDEQVLPHLTDLTLASAPVRRLRAQVTRGLHGEVIEVGFGSGANLSHLPPEVSSVHAVEPSATAWRRSAERRESAPVPVARLGLDGQRLPAADASYDSALSTFTLCTIPDPVAALRELRRVLRPGAALHFLEHGRAPDAGVLRWQRRLEPLQRRVAGGCHLSRDVPALLEDAGFEMEGIESGYALGGGPMRPWGYLYRGTARSR